MGVSYRDIKADVMSRISRGEWRPGGQIPNEADLAETYGCARATVNRAMRELAEEGVLDRRRKSGTRVRATPLRHARLDIPLTREEIEKRGQSYRYALVSRDIRDAPDWLCARLMLSSERRCVHLICLHYADGHPFQHEDRWICLATLPDAEREAFTDIGPNQWLVETVPFTDMDLNFSAVAADEEVALRLGCRAGDPLFQMERTTWLDGTPVTYVQLSYPPGYRLMAQNGA